MCVGDNYYEYFINNSTFLGSQPRPVLGYIAAPDTALAYSPQYFLMGHGSPICSRQVIKKTVSRFREALQYLYDATINGMNQGKGVYTLMQEIK